MLSAIEVGAVGTRSFLLDSEEDYEGGDLKGVSIDSTGKLRAGLNLGATSISEGTAVWSALPMPDGSVLLGTGNDGKLLRVTGAATKVIAETKALVITSLTQAWGGTVVMGTLPEGKVLKLEGDKVTDLVKLKDTEHVWQVAFDAKANALYAATGPEGKLYRSSGLSTRSRRGACANGQGGSVRRPTWRVACFTLGRSTHPSAASAPLCGEARDSGACGESDTKPNARLRVERTT